MRYTFSDSNFPEYKNCPVKGGVQSVLKLKNGPENKRIIKRT
jgi:hypothetical protein